MQQKFDFDVVIPTKNRIDDLNNLLQSINIQSILPQNVVIVDQSDSELIIESSKLYNIKHYYDNTISGLTEAKNKGVKLCKSEIIFFFDDDIILDPTFFEIIVNHFTKRPELSGICGRQKNSISTKFKLFMFDFFHIGVFRDIRKKCNSGYYQRELVPTKILPGGITAYKRKVFDEFNFDEVLIKYCLGEDMDFSYRASEKFRFAFATDALALHNHSAIGRYDPISSFACKVAGYAYFYKKNINKNVLNYMSYLWVEFGVIMDAIQYSIKNKNTNSLRGIIQGWRKVLSGFKDVPFISYEKLNKAI